MAGNLKRFQQKCRVRITKDGIAYVDSPPKQIPRARKIITESGIDVRMIIWDYRKGAPLIHNGKKARK